MTETIEAPFDADRSVAAGYGRPTSAWE